MKTVYVVDKPDGLHYCCPRCKRDHWMSPSLSMMIRERVQCKQCSKKFYVKKSVTRIWDIY